MLVSICIITYQRPKGLRRLLESLNRLTFDKIVTPNLEVIVIDNDASSSASQLCQEIQSNFQWVLKYGIEPQRGISYARNQSISCVSQDADFIVTIDDDEVPESFWLEQLLLVQQQYNADVVTGPVIARFEEDIPEWIEKGKFFEQSRHSTGKQMKVAFTNNVLVRAEVLKKLDKVFDDRFAITGGEDSHLFMRLYRDGYKIVWADEAIVYEWVPKSRTKLAWILRRNFHGWSAQSLLERELYPSLKVQAIRLAKGSGLILLGFLGLLLSLVQGKYAAIAAILNICRGAGTFAGFLGIRYEEYKKLDTDLNLDQMNQKSGVRI
jgi:succinoglycan biosynthesis protein ExoM